MSPSASSDSDAGVAVEKRLARRAEQCGVLELSMSGGSRRLSNPKCARNASVDDIGIGPAGRRTERPGRDEPSPRSAAIASLGNTPFPRSATAPGVIG